MGFCKLLLFIITFILLCSGIFGHRFQRHSKAVSPTPAAAIENVELNNSNLYNELASDESIGVPDENNITNIKLIRPGEIELELLHGELQFQICTKHCMDSKVAVCFESANPEQLAKGDCGTSQCEFKAGVQTTFRQKQIWFMDERSNMNFDDDTCENATMQSPTAIAFEEFPSCYPTKHDSNAVKLYVSKATQDCPLYVIGAKLWFPPTPPPPTAAPELSTEKTTSSKPPPSSSTADSSNTLWIIIGVVSGILVIALLIGLGCLIYYRCIKKKSTAAAAANADGKKIQISTETKTITEVQAPIVNQETEKEKNKAVEEEKKNDIKEKVTTTKEETEEQKPKKKASKRKLKKQKKKEGKEKKKVAPIPAPKAPTPNRTKPTQEETPPNVTGPTFEETMAQSVVSREPVAPKIFVPPTLCVPYKIIVPERQYATSNRDETDSLSGNHDLNMQMIVENPSQALARFYADSDPRHQSSNDKKPSKAKMQEIKAFYPVGKKARDFKREEISILCCRISTMFKDIETMRTTAKKKLEDHGAKFDKNGCIMKMPPGTLYYVQNRATAEYIRAFAFGALFSEEIDRYTASQIVTSIPLLFDIILQPRYPSLQRRKACAWIRRQIPVIFQQYTLLELERLAYPICAIEEAYDTNKRGCENSDVHTESNDEAQPPLFSFPSSKKFHVPSRRPLKGKLIEYNPMMDKM